MIVVRRKLKKLLSRLARTDQGRRLLRIVLSDQLDLCAQNLKQRPRSFPEAHLDLCLEVLGRYYNDRSSFETVQMPETIDGFEDLMWLFAPTPVNRGLARLDLDEAAYMWRLIRSRPGSRCVEIGRFKGGSTFLIASALRDGSELLSIDNHTKMVLRDDGHTYDDMLLRALQRYGLDDRVMLAVADSATYPTEGPVDVVFCDGDHSYEGVLRDVRHWQNAIRPGGHLLLHDASDARLHATCHEGVARLVAEMEQEPTFRKVAEAGSIVHFRVHGADPLMTSGVKRSDESLTSA